MEVVGETEEGRWRGQGWDGRDGRWFESNPHRKETEAFIPSRWWGSRPVSQRKDMHNHKPPDIRTKSMTW